LCVFINGFFLRKNPRILLRTNYILTVGNKQKMDKKEFELIFGILSLLASIIWGYYEIKAWNKMKKNDYMLKSFSIEVITGLIVFFMIGIAGIYRYFF